MIFTNYLKMNFYKLSMKDMSTRFYFQGQFYLEKGNSTQFY